MEQIIDKYYKDPFAFYIDIVDTDGNDLTRHPWTATLHTSDVPNGYVASFDGHRYINAHHDDKGVHIIVENHMLRPGSIVMMVEACIPDECFEGGYRLLHETVRLPYRIVLSPTNTDRINIRVKAVMSETVDIVHQILDEIDEEVESILGNVDAPDEPKNDVTSAQVPVLTRGVIPYTAEPRRVYRNFGAYRYTKSQCLSLFPDYPEPSSGRCSLSDDLIDTRAVPYITASAPGNYHAYQGPVIENIPPLPMPHFPSRLEISALLSDFGFYRGGRYDGSLAEVAPALVDWVDRFWPNVKGRRYHYELEIWDSGGKRRKGLEFRTDDDKYYSTNRPWKWRPATPGRLRRRRFGNFRVRLSNHNGKHVSPWLRVSFSPYGLSRLS